MENLIIPKDYHSELNLHDTQIAIKTVKDFFQNLLALRLNLSRVSAPLIVDPLSGLNDNLNGIERPVTFDIKEKDITLFHKLRRGIMGQTMNLPGKGGRKISVAAYRLSQKVVGFN